ncbi:MULTISPECIES: helix-turn-helix domain-containing protein [Vibrio]|uniref:DNA-binding transcriptional regulator Nlp n=1 Tax=Vibrio spartinae TaxID=1918945 RepID=A0A1N6M652_9VIBR|nr:MULTISPECIES: helix-turn-helix domain-containing protein [Vibrio]WNJ96572.1 helix-turn-helix domain-containing protein [Vibrio ruber]SIO94826.1 DNA-binding transcriptional regulator Nlp [Vibrio spartinae]
MDKESIKKDWHRADIVAALRKKGLSLTSLSIDAGLAPGTLKNVMRVKYPKAEEIVATALGVEPSVIWPSRYQKG